MLFKDMIFTVHPKDIPGEMAGKSANDSFALSRLLEGLDQQTIDRSIITVIDADSWLHERYFEHITYKFLTVPERYECVYQPLVCNYKNSDQAPAVTRIAAHFSAMFEYSSASDVYYHHLPHSTYSASIKFLQKYKAWDPNIICEDTHVYVSSFFYSHGTTRVEPIFLPVLGTVVGSDTYLKSVQDRYQQAVRHSFGICELVFALRQIAQRTKSLPTWRVFTLLWRIATPHYLPFIQLFAVTLTTLHLQLFKDEEANVLAGPFIALQQLTLIALIGVCFANFCALRQVNTSQSYTIYHFVKFLLEYLILGPISTIVLGTVPFFVAVTKLIFSETLVYVTATRFTPTL
jgi:hypothetical protein